MFILRVTVYGSSGEGRQVRRDDQRSEKRKDVEESLYEEDSIEEATRASGEP